MRILFLGDKLISVHCLSYLLQNKEDVVGVFVNSGKVTATSARSVMHIVANAYNIPVYCKNNINSASTVKLIKKLKPDVVIVIYFDQILKKEVISIPKQGCINMHFALAEKYRGCYPTTWAIINGEKITGVTMHYITEFIDAGDIISEVKVPILKTETGESLYYKCTDYGFKLFKKVFPKIKSGKIKRRTQVKTKDTKYYTRRFPSHQLYLTKVNYEFYNYIRAITFPLFPYPYFYIGNRKFVIKEEFK